LATTGVGTKQYNNIRIASAEVVVIVLSPMETFAGYYQGANDRVNHDAQEVSSQK
jgi:hypothetical protein